MTFAVICYLIAVAAVLVAEPVLQREFGHNAMGRWMNEHVYLPGLRAGAVTVLLLTAYPAMFEPAVLPTLSEVLSGGPERGRLLFNLMVLITIVLPLLELGPAGAAVLPVQAMVGASVLFHWAVSAAGLDAYAVPAVDVVLSVIAIATLAEFLARGAERLIRPNHPEWARLVTHDSIVLIFQLPALIIWTRALGRQLVV